MTRPYPTELAPRRIHGAAAYLRMLLAGVVVLLLAGCAGGDGGEASTTTMAARPDTTAAVSTTAAPTSTTGAVGAMPPVTSGEVGRWVPEIVERRPHDPEAFTQGLLIEGGVMYESTGLYGESSLREVDPDSGEVIRRTDIEADLFTEGLELVDDRLLQLTWQEETLVVWDAASFEEVDRITYQGEGWGLCENAGTLVMSNGSSRLTMRDPVSFEPTGEIDVTLDGAPVERLNELECVDGLVFANVWQTDQIVVVDPESGEVVADIDASRLDEELADEPGRDVLNGIAYDSDADTFLLTGKLWPALFEVRFVEG